MTKKGRKVAMKTVTLATVSVLAVALTPAVILAARASVNGAGTKILYRAQGGETNNVTLGPGVPSGVTITDTGANITPGNGCTANAANSVTCTPSALALTVVVVGDGDDTVNASLLSTPLKIVGGSGNDNLTGGSGDDLIIGGSGNDTIDGGPGSDTIRAGGGDDTINAVDGTPDKINCGGGTDTVIADPGTTDTQSANCP